MPSLWFVDNIRFLRHDKFSASTLELVPSVWSVNEDADQAIDRRLSKRPNREYYPSQDNQNLFNQLSS